MTDCRFCGSTKAHNAFLCRPCLQTLNANLRSLPWWLGRLTETVVGQTRMSDNGGRRSARRADINGEKPLAECIEPLPNEADLKKARKAREQHALSVALAAGGCNARASQLLADIADSLAYWVRVLSETAGQPIPHLPAGTTTGVPHTLWLTAHINAIAAHEDAADIATDVAGHILDIIACVNRPVPIRDLGPCPTWIEHDGRAGHPCGVPLRAPADDTEVHCRRCRTTHNVNRLLLARMEDLEHEHYTAAELVRIMRRIPEEYRVTDRTLRRWRESGKLTPVGWRRGGPDGRTVIITKHSDADTPVYAWSDVQRLKATDRRVGV